MRFLSASTGSYDETNEVTYPITTLVTGTVARPPANGLLTSATTCTEQHVLSFLSTAERPVGTCIMSTLPDYPNLNYGAGAKWIKHLTHNRLSTFTGGHFSDVNLSSLLFVHRLDGPHYVKLQVWSAPGLTKPSFKEAMQQKFKEAKKGDSFGPSCELGVPYTRFWSLTESQGYGLYILTDLDDI